MAVGKPCQIGGADDGDGRGSERPQDKPALRHRQWQAGHLHPASVKPDGPDDLAEARRIAELKFAPVRVLAVIPHTFSTSATTGPTTAVGCGLV